MSLKKKKKKQIKREISFTPVLLLYSSEKKGWLFPVEWHTRLGIIIHVINISKNFSTSSVIKQFHP